MADAAKPTIASLAKELDQLRQAADVNPEFPAALAAAEAKDAAGTAIDITAALGKDIATLKQEQTALAQLVNGLKREPGDAVKPSKLDNVLARLEAVERNGTQDWSPMIEAYGGKVDALATAVKNVADSVTAMEDKTGVQPGGPFEDLVAEVAELRKVVDGELSHELSSRLTSVAQGLGETRKQYDKVASGLDHHGELIDQLRGGAAGVDPRELSALVLNEVNEQVARIVRNRASFEQDLLARVRNLEDSGLPGGLSSTITHVPAVGNVHAKLLELMREVDHIAKSRTAKGGGMNYKFRGIDDAQNAVGQAMRKIGLLLQPEVIDWQYVQTPVDGFDDKGRAKTTVWSTSRLTMGYTFVSPDDGSSFTFSMIGEGRDAGDKSGSKAASMACKYALFQALMVPLEVDESDGHNPVAESYRDERPAASNTPGARVSRGEITPAQAVQEYQQPKVQVPPGGYNPAMDSSAMAGADTDDTLMQKAAQAAHYLKQAQAQPAEVALPAIKRLMERVEAYEIGDMKVSWSDDAAPIPLNVMISTALQSVNAMLVERARAAGAQGVTRQGQQSGEGARAAAHDKFQQELAAEQEPPPNYEGSKRQYEDALQALAQGAPDDVIDSAMRVVADYERASEENTRFGGSAVAHENPLNPGGTASGDHDY
jgi:hypothetical protein